MPSRSLRKDVVPPKAIALWFCANACRPSDYCHVTAYNGKYIKSVPACTNPGTTGGASTHQHCGTTVPAHPGACPSTAPHSHPGGTSPSAGSPVLVGPFTSSPAYCPPVTYANPRAAYQSHTHANPAGSNTAPVGSIPAHISHQHPTSCNSPPNVTTSFIQKANSVSIRKRTLPKTVKAIWTCTLASIPCGYVKYTTYLGKILQAVTNACTNPGTTGGCTCHTHGSANAHTHPISIAAHTHPQTNDPKCTGTALTCSEAGGNTQQPAGGHTHPSTVNSGCGSGTSACAGAHSIAASCVQPAFYTVVPINSSSVSMRKNGVPKKTILIWKCAIACIPTCFALANGSSCTPNLLCKYLKTVATACTNPGGTGGANSHSHTCPSTHSHTVSIPHSHPQTYSGNAPGGGFSTSGSSNAQIGSHNHNATVTGGSGCAPTTLLANASHTHASVSNEPSNIQVAYIQRL